MKILITGATGFIGQEIVRKLFRAGHPLVILSRDAERARLEIGLPLEYFSWNPETSLAPENAFNGVETIIHLAGHPVAGGRWTHSVKKKIRDSRVLGTKNLMFTLQKLASPPKAIISGSAIGYYEEAADQILTESSPVGNSFLSSVCRDWETEVFQNAPQGMRRAVIRTGVVLGRRGGALKKMLPIFKAGLGGTLGFGKAYMSWIHLDDIVDLFITAALNKNYEGIFNGTAPEPVTNAQFTRELARAFHKPALFPVPTPVLKIAFGEMSTVILGSQRVLPQRALAAGFKFSYSNLRQACEELAALGAGNNGFVVQQWLPRRVDQVFDFFSRAQNLELITPPWLNFRVKNQSTKEIESGTLIDYKLKLHGFPFHWQTLIRDFKKNEFFSDIQKKGPYRRWEHTHRFESLAEGTLVTDEVVYSLPFGALGELVAGSFVEKDVNRIFSYRREVLAKMFGS